MRIRNIDRIKNDIIIKDMTRPSCVGDFIRIMYEGISCGYEEFNIKLEHPKIAVYPNACVPIAGLLEYHRQNGVIFNIDIAPSEYLHKCHFEKPLYLSSEEISKMDNPFDKIFKYDTSKQVASFTQKCIDSISQQMVCEEGVLKSLIWCINEVMDNVLVHSNEKCGYVMVQLHPTSGHVAICISDTGIGIFNTLKGSPHYPKCALDALTLALQEGVGDGLGQGNGLFGLFQIVKSNGGRLGLTSGPACIHLEGNSPIRKFDTFPYTNKRNQGTIVDFQLDLNRQVDIAKAFSSIGGFDGFDIRIDNMIQEDDSILYDIFANCSGTATREAGRLVRNDIINTIRRSNCPVILDFSGVATVSSSFIDELIAKMIIEMGLIKFNQIVSIKDMNETVRFLCERSTYMRIYEEWKNKA